MKHKMITIPGYTYEVDYGETDNGEKVGTGVLFDESCPGAIEISPDSILLLARKLFPEAIN